MAYMTVTRTIAFFLAAAYLTVVMAPAAFAQARVTVVRDAEIEALISEYARPILKAAGLARSGIDIVLVNNRSFNAFVDGRRIFIHTGALTDAETPNEVIGVIAHEAGHIAGGHQERLRQQLQRAQTMAIVSALIGIGENQGTQAARLGQSGRPAAVLEPGAL